jgi:hypothetical protein
MAEEALFSRRDLHSVLEAQQKTMLEEIDRLDEGRILSASLEDLSDYFERRYRIEPLSLKEESIQTDHGDASVDVSGRFDYDVRPGEGPVYVRGTRVSFFLPFEGEADLFECQPSPFSTGPQASVGEKEVTLSYSRTEKDAEGIGAEFRRDLTRIKTTVERIDADVKRLNDSLRGKAKDRIENRRAKLLRDQGLVASLGFPVRRRTDAPKTYTVPVVRKKVTPVMPAAGTGPFAPEPALEMKVYEETLSIMSNMVTVMEQSPRAFRTLEEEDLRTHFLVQLNGQYEGQATGETFNFQGKTDILIRANGRNIFIAECKFWRGPKSLEEAIDQLLGYASWRDTKTALVIFNRDRSLSTVLERVPEVVKGHPSFKRQLPYTSESGFRFVFGRPDDMSRELIITVLVFEVPA